MTNVQNNFSQIRWNNNLFRIIDRTQSSICIAVIDLCIQNEPPRNTKLTFKNPTSEWAMLWDAKTEVWKEHPDRKHPIGDAIVEAAVKVVGRKQKFSFAGNHKLGWSRWGFSADRIEIENER